MEEEVTQALFELRCELNHGFDKLIMLLARKIFNMFAKNYSQEINSQLHKKSPTKRSKVAISQTSSKVEKLQSK